MTISTQRTLVRVPLAIIFALGATTWAVGPAQAADTEADQTTTTSTAETHSTDGTSGTSGDPSESQPLSTADENDGGANGECPDGPYCSTRDGSPSENGQGEGEAKGKPCAGCVGKADNKNPQGQMPDGSDPNAGYECDSNEGVGQGNPAHTGCTAGEGTETDVEAGTDDETVEPGEDTEPEDGTESDEVEEGDDEAEEGGEEAGGAADDDLTGSGGGEQVLGVEVEAGDDDLSGVGGGSADVEAEAVSAGGVLPDTGLDGALTPMLLGGVALLGLGTALLLRSRRARLGL